MDIDTRSKRTSPKPPKILGAILSLFKIDMFPQKMQTHSFMLFGRE
ncbi:hypothetical protein SMB34_13395 [Thalassospira permensis NBRC 106175]|uniref:Transposase n=1 Tax=Thalassospira permensis NBRC 106175 TaxID=1353532 RepID=A0ABR4TRT8_9PROT|nr:hypothetical protein SMB34_13395 [Thalassospira permensis NBRC 106175]